MIVTEEDEVVVTFGFTFTVDTTFTKYTEAGFREYEDNLNLSALEETDNNEDAESTDHTPSRYTLTLHTYEVSGRTTLDPRQSTRAV
jgi:hypothetical protein